MCRYILVGLLGLMPMAAYAQDPRTCAALSDDKARLECYDLAHRKTTNVTSTSQWRVVEDKSKLDDSREVSLSVLSAEMIRGKYRQPKHAALFINCREKTTDLYVVFGDHFMSDLSGGGRVNTRVDKSPARTVSMRQSNDHSALGLWDGATAIPFIKSLFGGNSLYVRATPHTESAVEMEFPIAGLEEAIKPLREACKW